MEPSKKTMRHFYCRDVLWETFEQMANDFECSIDYLVNESMRAYAKSKNYAAGSSQQVPEQLVDQAKDPNAARNTPPGPTSPVPPNAAAAALRAAELRAAEEQAQQQAAAARPPSPPPAPGPKSVQRAAASAAISATRAVAEAPPAPALVNGPLFLSFNGQKYTIEKEQFVIGRGSKTADLSIKDGNISRRHAAVIRRNGTFYIKDLGSTNGIDYKGMRIDNKRIDEGDVFHLCDYELRFTYKS